MPTDSPRSHQYREYTYDVHDFSSVETDDALTVVLTREEAARLTATLADRLARGSDAELRVYLHGLLCLTRQYDGVL